MLNIHTNEGIVNVSELTFVHKLSILTPNYKQILAIFKISAEVLIMSWVLYNIDRILDLFFNAESSSGISQIMGILYLKD